VGRASGDGLGLRVGRRQKKEKRPTNKDNSEKRSITRTGKEGGGRVKVQTERGRGFRGKKKPLKEKPLRSEEEMGGK